MRSESRPCGAGRRRGSRQVQDRFIRWALNLMLFSPRTARMETMSRRQALRVFGKESIWGYKLQRQTMKKVGMTERKTDGLQLGKAGVSEIEEDGIEVLKYCGASCTSCILKEK